MSLKGGHSTFARLDRRKAALLSLISSSVNQGATIYVGLVVFGVRKTGLAIAVPVAAL